MVSTISSDTIDHNLMVKLLSFQEYSDRMLKNPTPNSLHCLMVEFEDGRIEPFVQQFKPLLSSEYGKKFRVWEIMNLYETISYASTMIG